jgi:hypothetical protein
MFYPFSIALNAMRLIRILKQESAFLVAREALWRAQREWNRRRIVGRLRRPGRAKFRNVPYYRPELQSLSDQSRALIIAFADEIRAGRYPFLSYGTVELGTLPNWNLDFVSGRGPVCNSSGANTFAKMGRM